MEEKNINNNDNEITVILGSKYMTENEQYELLKQRQDIIDECIEAISNNFFKLGKALAEIKDFKLYKSDPEFKKWKDYVEHRIGPKLHQSTISDYISIVKMQMLNKEFIGKNELVKLGYKKAKLLKTKFNQIMKIKDAKKKEQFLYNFRSIYKKTYEELIDAPFTTYEKRFDFIKSDPDKVKDTSKIDIKSFENITYQIDKENKQIIISTPNDKELTKFYNWLIRSNSDTSAIIESKPIIPSIIPPTLVDEVKVYSFFQEIPKTEIHLHLEALVSVDTIFELMQKYKIDPTIKTIDDVHDRFKVDNLNDFIKLFFLVQSCFQKSSDFELIIKDARNYFKRNHIYYAEIFFAPSKFIEKGHDFDEMIEIIDKGIDKTKIEDNITIKVIVDVSRSFGPEISMRNLDLVLASKSPHIIGIGLGGAEAKGPAKDYKEVFAKAREKGLKVVAHAGEDVGPESIWSALKDLHVERIGHGISAMLDEELMLYLKDFQIPLEVCPTSNIFTQKYVKKLKEHPIRKFFDKGLMVTLNSDDPAFFGVDVTDEYLNLHLHLDFSIKQLIQLVKNNLYACFMPELEKEIHWKKVEEEIPKLLAKYDLTI